MADLEKLKAIIEEQKKAKMEAKAKRGAQKIEAPAQKSIDTDQVEKIVDRMQKKYRQEGASQPEVGGKLGELKGAVASEQRAKLSLESVEELQEFKSPIVKSLGKFYLTMKFLFEPIANLVNKLPIASDVRYYLFSANMRYSLQQWLALSVVAAFIISVFVFIGLTIVSLVFEISFTFPVITTVVVWLFTFAIMLMVPKNRAMTRGNQVSVELPFALRQMATELKSGIGLYKAITTIASSDYGVLSEEFNRTITEIEEGTDTKDALKHFAMRTQSKSLRVALSHLVRAMRTGGNLSEAMNEIAQDVSFDLRLSISDFAEKMNFFGEIYIFIAIVAPVFIGIIGTVTNAPITALQSVSFPPMLIALIYMAGFPMVLGLMTFYIKMIEPRV